MAIIIVGIVLIAVAAIGIFFGYSNGDWVISALAWGALIVGALVTLFGFGKRQSDQMQTPEGAMPNLDHIEIRALVQSMGAVAMADGKVHDQEILTIARIHKQMLGISITADEVREILADLGAGFDIVKQLTEDRSSIGPAMKRTIVQACQLVMISDAEIVSQEENRVVEIGKALGFDTDSIDDLIATAVS